MSRGIAIFLCDLTGTMGAPWVEAGYSIILVDPQHPPGVSVEVVYPDSDVTITRVGHIIDHPATWAVLRESIATGMVCFTMGFPPCTDVAVSGTPSWAKKRAADPQFQAKAAVIAEQCRTIGQMTGKRWAFENPVSVFSSIFGKARYGFHPFEFTGICVGDNYTKNTQLWTSEDFVMPEANMHGKVAEAVAMVKAMCGRLLMKPKALALTDNHPLIAEWYPDDRIHKAAPSNERANFRSATPNGFSVATFKANAPHLQLRDLLGDPA